MVHAILGVRRFGLHPRFDGQPAGPAIDQYDPTCSNSSRIARVNARELVAPDKHVEKTDFCVDPTRPGLGWSREATLGLATIGETRSTICEHSATTSVHCARNSIASRSEELTGWHRAEASDTIWQLTISTPTVAYAKLLAAEIGGSRNECDGLVFHLD